MPEFYPGDRVRVSIDLEGVVMSTGRCCERDFITVDVGFADDDPSGHGVDIPTEYVTRLLPVKGTIRKKPEDGKEPNVAVWQGTGWETLNDWKSDPRYYDDWPIIYTPKEPV